MCLIFEDENKSSSDEKDNLQSTVHMIGSLSSKAARYMKRCCKEEVYVRVPWLMRRRRWQKCRSRASTARSSDPQNTCKVAMRKGKEGTTDSRKLQTNDISE